MVTRLSLRLLAGLEEIEEMNNHPHDTVCPPMAIDSDTRIVIESAFRCDPELCVMTTRLIGEMGRFIGSYNGSPVYDSKISQRIATIRDNIQRRQEKLFREIINRGASC